VFFTTSQPLVNGDTDSGVDLYEADISEGSISRLVQVSRGGEGDLTPGSGANVLGVARVSEDGSHVYFVAEGRLTGANREGKTPSVGQPNLYVVARGCPGGGTACASPVERTSFVGTLSAENDGADWGASDERSVQATPDGQFLVFQSSADLTSDEEGQEEAGQVFEYDAQTETLVRVSRGQGGYNRDGNSSIYPAIIPTQDYKLDQPIQRITDLAVSEDGSRVFFSSPAALTPRALNGVVIKEEEGRTVYATNIYEYHEGQVGLISDGHDTVLTEHHPAVGLIGTDETGLDVFFMTADSLVPRDTDTQVDVYDARVGGGFAPPPQAAPCVADSCQDAPVSPPSLLAPLTSSVSGEAVSLGSQRTAPPKKKSERRRRKMKSKVKPMRRTKRTRHGNKRTAGGRT